jgi:hypothetical protein
MRRISVELPEATLELCIVAFLGPTLRNGSLAAERPTARAGLGQDRPSTARKSILDCEVQNLRRVDTPHGVTLLELYRMHEVEELQKKVSSVLQDS